MADTKTADFEVVDYGSIVQIIAHSEDAINWIDENVDAPPYMWNGTVLNIETASQVISSTECSTMGWRAAMADEYETLYDAIREALADYDRSLTGGEAASEITNRLYDALRRVCKVEGQDPVYEVYAWHPHSSSFRGPCWGVSWEAGPFQWAIGASFIVMDMTGRLCEPHYSFDLCLYEVE